MGREIEARTVNMTSLSLRTKIITRLAIISICAMSVLLIVLYRYVSRTLRTELVTRGQFIAHSLAEQSANPILTQKELVLALMLRNALKADKDIDYIYITDTRREIVAHTFAKNFPAGLMKTGNTDEKSVRRVRINSHDVLHVSSPILHGSLGTLHVGLLESTINRELARIFILAASLIVVLFIAAAILMWLTIEQAVIRPVQNLDQRIRGIRNGTFQGSLQIVAEDEIGQLGHSFNMMAEHLGVIDLQRNNVITELHETNSELTRLVSEREMAERRVAESEEKLRLILDSAGEGIYGIDMQGRCSFCNRSCLRLLGYESQDELIGKKMHAQIHHSFPDGRPYPVEQCRIYSSFKRGENVHVDRDVLWKADGTPLPVEYWSYPQIKDGKIIGSVVTFVDIAQRLEAEEENKNLQQMLLQSQKMDAMGTLAGGIAHDFNNILAVIFGYTELARRRCGNDPRLSDNLDQIMVASERARELVTQILTFSRHSEMNKQPLELVPLIKETLKLIRSSIPATIEIRQELDDNAVALADPTQIHQVIMNLCTNAYHAMAENGGTLAVSLKKKEITDEVSTLGVEIPLGRYAVIEVSDTGCGMSSEIQQKIFEPYFTTRGKGSGLGLAVVHGIVKNHGGKITVYSEEGAGASFHVYLPLAATDAIEEKMPESEISVSSRGESIMFIDDEQQIRDMAQEFLQEHGYRVEAYRDGTEALEHFKKTPHSYNLIITDMAMPGISGKDLSKGIRAIRPDIPIILCTGYSELINGESAREIGINEYLQKPVPMSHLCACIRKLLDESAVQARHI